MQTAPNPNWDVHTESVDSAASAALLRHYYIDIIGRYYGRATTEGEVDAVMAEYLNDDLAPPSGLFLLATYDGQPAGCAGLRLGPAYAELTRVFVDPRFRGLGGGGMLLAAAEECARAAGAGRIRLDTRKDLIEARRLYARHGYVEIAAYNDERYADHWFEKRWNANRDSEVDGESGPR